VPPNGESNLQRSAKSEVALPEDVCVLSRLNLRRRQGQLASPDAIGPALKETLPEPAAPAGGMALQESAAAGIARWIPAVDWLRHYRRDWLGRDLLAGITAGAVVLPKAMGDATVAGLPVQMGLYTCLVPMVVYALLGGARRLSMSTTSTDRGAHRSRSGRCSRHRCSPDPRW
jgi:hypothetical protein